MAVPGRGNRVGAPLRVAVASDQRLVAESVAMALRNRSFDPVVVQWPAEARAARPAARRRPSGARRALGAAPDVGLIVTDLLRMEQVRGAQVLLSGLAVPWAVLVAVPSGPAWGALYDCGAFAVAANDTGLDAVCQLVTDVAAGREPLDSRRDRKQLVRSWHTFAAQRKEMTARLGTLSDREEEVLHHLHEGLGVRAIAERSDVAEATVRSQVKSILRKLAVNSQLAAVLVYDDVITDSTRAASDPPRAS